jgi:hypothetical protein
MELRPGFWDVGLHEYDFRISSVEGDAYFHIEFTVTESAPLHNQQVLLRLSGLHSADGQIPHINPDQDTALQLSWLIGQDRQEAEEFRDTEKLEVRLDSGDWIDVAAGPLTKDCARDNPARFQRNWGPYKID